MILRDYQQKASNEILDAIGNGYKSILVVAPTGSGKTEIMKHLCTQVPGTKYATAHTKPLINQLKSRLHGYAKVIGVHSKKKWRDIQDDVSLIFIDEAHHSAADGYRHLFNRANVCIGFTATPNRSDAVDLNDFYKITIDTVSYSDLINQGYLTAPNIFVRGAPKLNKLKVRLGDYVVSDISSLMSQDRPIGNVISSIKEYENRKAVVYCCDRNHCGAIELAIKNELPSRKVFTLTHDVSRNAAEILDAFLQTENGVLLNITMLTEGWDMPQMDFMVIARPTLSDILHQQIIGRCLRKVEGKEDAVIIDLAGNCISLGIPQHNYEGSTFKPKETKNDKWTCNLCSFSNQNIRIKCVSCGASKPKSGPGIWVCTTEIMERIECGSLNSAALLVCPKCHVDRKYAVIEYEDEEICNLKEITKKCDDCNEVVGAEHFCTYESLYAAFGLKRGNELKAIINECIDKNRKVGWMFFRMQQFSEESRAKYLKAAKQVYAREMLKKTSPCELLSKDLSRANFREETEKRLYSHASLGRLYGLKQDTVYSMLSSHLSNNNIKIDSNEIKRIIYRAF